MYKTPIFIDITFYFTNYLYLTLGGSIEILGSIFIPSGDLYGNSLDVKEPDYSLLNGLLNRLLFIRFALTS